MAHNSFLEKNSVPPTKPPDLAGEPKSAPIKPGGRADIKAAQCELDDWITQQRNADVLAAARNVWHSLAAAQIGARLRSLPGWTIGNKVVIFDKSIDDYGEP